MSSGSTNGSSSTGMSDQSAQASSPDTSSRTSKTASASKHTSKAKSHTAKSKTSTQHASNSNARLASAGKSAHSSETAYRSKLRQCVQQPTDQRESCLDRVIEDTQRS